MKSRSLGRNLKQCEKLILFGATLGTGADRLITRASLTDMAKAVVLQACAAAMLEEYCDACQREIAKQQEKEGWYLRPRFSPGYGDFDIQYQKPLMQMLDCAKTIGLTMTDSFMMTPTKSVTAVIGMSRIKERCPIQGCEICEKRTVNIEGIRYDLERLGKELLFLTVGWEPCFRQRGFFPENCRRLGI